MTATIDQVGELRRVAADLAMSANGEIADLAELVSGILDLVAPAPVPRPLPATNRDGLLWETADRFLAGLSERDQAKRLRDRLGRYRSGAWRRWDRTAQSCPYADTKIERWLWHLLKTKDALPGITTIRNALSKRPGPVANLANLQLATAGETVLDAEEQDQK